MTASTYFKGLFAAAAAVTLVGTAVAQGTPPTPAATDPAVGAGQRSSQNTPMGATGTPGGGGAAAAGSTSSGGMAAGSGSTGGSSMSGSMGSTGGGTAATGSMGTDTGSGARSGARATRADRG